MKYTLNRVSHISDIILLSVRPSVRQLLVYNMTEMAWL